MQEMADSPLGELNAQREERNGANPDHQDHECYGVVIEPIVSLKPHDAVVFALFGSNVLTAGPVKWQIMDKTSRGTTPALGIVGSSRNSYSNRRGPACSAADYISATRSLGLKDVW
jgi:hypothetical protein